MRHLFFALSPAPALRARIAAEARRLHATWGGRATAPEKLHMTLRFLDAFPDPLPPDIVAAARAAGEAVEARAFDLVLDQAGHFGRRVAWLGCSQPPGSLVALHGDLTSACAARGVPMRREDGFVPHVTVAREPRHPSPAAIAPMAWPVEGFVLMASAPGAYDVLGAWRLRAPGEGA